MESDLVPIGRYNCRIVCAREATSRRGNEMIVLDIEIEGFPGRLTDFLVLTDSCEWRLAQFFAAFHGRQPLDGERISPELGEVLTDRENRWLKCDITHELDSRSGSIVERITWLPQY